MIRARVLWALKRLATTDPAALSGTYGPVFAEVDPLLRHRVRRAVFAVVARARAETEHAADEPHVHRLAYLLRAGGLAPDPNDRERVRHIFDEASAGDRPPLRRAPSLVLGAGALALALAGTLVLWPSAPPLPLRELARPSARAWVEGGRPLPGDGTVRTFFAEDLPDYVVALDRIAVDDAPVGPLMDARAHLLGVAADVLGRVAASHLEAVLDQAEALVVSDTGRPAAASHLETLDAFNGAIAERGLGHYLDGQVLVQRATGRARVIFASFEVEHVTPYESAGQRVRALRLRRLDRLNVVRGALGFTRPQIRDALVLMGRIEEHLVGHVLPALAPESAMPLSDPASSVESWVPRLQSAVAAAARAEAAALAGDGETVERLGAIFEQRAALVRRWNERLDLRVVLPQRVDLTTRELAGLREIVPRREWRALERTRSEASRPELRRAYAALEAALVASVERHEVQHRLDYLARGDAAETLEVRVDGRPFPIGERGTAELSAYLAELARGPELVRTNLALVTRHVFDRRRWGSAEANAALVILDQLRDALEGPSGAIWVGRRVDRAAAARLVRALLERPTGALSAAAAARWEVLFGRPLPPIDAEG
ncbi:MAG: hypothetical protein AAGH15_24645 [Myxococcota bacterium]